MVQFLQAGDFHLGSNFSSSALSGKKARKRRQELLDTFQKIINKGIESGVDLILITGDLFEHQYANQELLKFIGQVLAGAAPIPVFISPGNHDPAVKNSYYHSYNWPDNVHIFTEQSWTSVELQDLGVTVYGLGWQQRNIEQPLLQELKIVDQDQINIVCLHGDLLTDSKYLPLTDKELLEAGGDYYALGHIHQAQRFMIAGKNRAAYAGSAEPLDINETGVHGFYLGRVDKSEVELELVPAASRNYAQGIIQLEPADTYHQVREKIGSVIEQPDNLFRIILRGEIDPELELDLELLIEEFAESVFHLELVDETVPGYDLENLKKIHQDNAIGLFIRALEEKIAAAGPEETVKLEKALFYGLDALLGRRVVLR